MPSHGGSSELTRMLLNETPRPKIFNRGSNVKLHLQAVDTYLIQLKVTDDKTKFDVLLNSIEEDCRYEIFSLFEYDDNVGNSKWLVSTFQRLFGEKETPLKSMMRLLKVRQKPKQKLSEFLSEVRIEGFKVYGHTNKEEREKFMILAFIDGLRSRKASFVLKEANLKTLDECYKFVETDEPDILDEDSCEINAVSQNGLEKRVHELEILVRQLKGKLDFISKERQQQGRASGERFHRGKQFQYHRREVTTREMNDGKCFNCGKRGHIARFCYAKGNRRSVNNILEDIDDEVSSCSPSDSSPPVMNDESESEVVTAVDVANVEKRHTKKYMSRNHSRPEKNISAWTQYIQGQGGKPKAPLRASPNHQYAKTVIGTGREIKNKALILCEVEGRTTKVLFDSGSTQNVISEELFCEIGGQRRFQLFGESRSLKCANNLKLNCLGNVFLHVRIGNTSCKKVFTVVEELSQKAIIGIRGMKASNIIIDAGMNGIFCSDEFLPFVGKVSAPTEFQENI